MDYGRDCDCGTAMTCEALRGINVIQIIYTCPNCGNQHEYLIDTSQ